MAAAQNNSEESRKPAVEQWNRFIRLWRAARGKILDIHFEAEHKEPLKSAEDLRDTAKEVLCILAAGLCSKFIHDPSEVGKFLKRLERGQQAALQEIAMERGPMCLLTEGDSLLVGIQSFRVWMREMSKDDA